MLLQVENPRHAIICTVDSMTTIHLFNNTLKPHQEVVTFMLCQQSTRANHVVYLVCNTWAQDVIGEFVAR
jgi:hypothetical protein